MPTHDSPAAPTPQPLPDETPASAEQEATNARLAGATGILALGNIASRVLGLARETVLTFLFGPSAAVDAFQVAIIVPKTLYDLLIGGHVNGAIVPVLTEIVTLKGREELWRVVSILASLLVTLLAGLVLLLQAFAPQIVQLTASGADETAQMLAVDLLRLTSPALLFMGLFAILSGALYALRSFTYPAFAGVLFNGTIVVTTMLLAPPLMTLLAPPGASGRAQDGIVAAAIGWLLGALAQLALQFPGLRGSRLRFTLNWRHPALRAIALLYVPVMFSLIVDTLIIRPFSYNLASQTGSGSIAYMNWATTLIQFPQGLVATAISIAILPMLASQAALITEARAFKDTLGLGLRLTMTLILPATIGLFVLAQPIVVLLFEHGAFTPDATLITVQALRLYLIGLPFAAVDLLLVYAFYARKDTLTPALVGILSLIVYMGVALLLLPELGLFSLMIADSIKHLVHAAVSWLLLRRKLEGFGAQRLLITIFKAGAASVAMGLAASLLLPPLSEIFSSGGIFAEALLVLLSGGAASLVFLGSAYALRVEELSWIVGLVRQRLGRRAR